MSIFPSFGGAAYSSSTKKVIRLILKGCSNRPFFHISVQEGTKEPYDPVIEQIGNYDPLPNEHNEKLVAINYQRLEHWLREGATVTNPVRKLLGLSGYFPVHPESFRNAADRRKQLIEELEKLKIEVAEIQAKEESSKESSTATAETLSSEEQSTDSQPEEKERKESSQQDDTSTDKDSKS